ncbi:MAG: TetR/AcrR family transcriptional regulator [Bacteroidetes bacterium]|nr:MAG: TetR/AcrR family transcriptional regulator [Bacteroidota bacterium]RLD72946.1 MAG: TetR/AcrR family transcriptional regulator [Bacteroidota bacterium]RLD87774.1 MAG: TetR/AcrR family transcriptional regulator [Bacteroidota bacterium]
MVVVKEEVRLHIVGIARRIFTRYGFRKTTMDEIASASQMGKSSVYYYFKSKEDIFRAVVEFEAIMLKERLNRIISKDNSPTERLKAYILFRLHHVKTLENFYAALNEETLSHMGFILEIRRNFEIEEQELVSKILEDGMEQGVFQLSSSKIGAIAISTMMKGLEVPLLLDEAHKTDREELLEDLIRVLLYGILKR